MSQEIREKVAEGISLTNYSTQMFLEIAKSVRTRVRIRSQRLSASVESVTCR